MDRKAELDRVLQRTNLLQFFPQKINFQDVMAASIDYCSNITTNDSIPFKILRTLIMLDYSARDKITLQGTDTGEPVTSEVDDLEELFTSSESCNSVHPSDLFQALFHCCNLNLRQVLFQKMFTCKMALPIFMPKPGTPQIEANIWPLRPIIIEWCDTGGEKRETPCVDVQQHIVSTIRIGKHSESKSNVINQLLSESHHNYFYNKTCQNSSDSRMIDGYIEGTWFIPAKANDTFSHVTMFLNLRGDAVKNTHMANFLSEISSAIIVMVDIKDLKEQITKLDRLSSKCPRIVFLLLNKTHIDKSEIKALLQDLIDQKLLGEDLKQRLVIRTEGHETKSLQDIKTKLKEHLTKTSPTTLASIVEKYTPKQLSVDEGKKDCLKGKILAQRFMDHIRIGNCHQSRKDVLPLQGNPWLKFSRLLKDERRVLTKNNGDDSIAAKDQLKRNRQTMRKLQYAESVKPNYVMNEFIEILQQLSETDDTSESSEDIDYFLKWLQLELDKNSRTILPNITRKYNDAYREYRKKKDDGSISRDQVEKLAKSVKICNNELSNVAIGIEHVFRELGQIYECSVTEDLDPRKKELINRLPGIMAKLMVRGHTFEIMDGDVSCIPSTWVDAVFKEVQKLIGDKKVLVISILGVQSSGKSTLLNTMFGMQFPVSAGRCTKGVFAQLLPVNQNSRHDFQYNYILVVDTEGLRAPELSFLRLDHDNEIAAFALGLADVSIVNIKGENTNDMRDTLQIAMHAFLRMNMAGCNLRSKQRCVFVHNNVSALSAKDKTQRAQHMLEDSLDTIVAEAAQAVKCTNIRSFREVLEFDGEKHVWFLSDLWRGDPPMAPINPGYANQIAEIKTILTFDIASKHAQVLKLSDFQQRLKDLWNAILSEDFIFSFKNSLEAKVYESILQEFLRLKRSLHRNVLQWVTETAGRIFRSCPSSEQLHRTFENLSDKLEREVDSEITNARDEMIKYFEEDEFKEMKIQWRENKLIELDNCRGSVFGKAKQRIESLRDERHLVLINSQEKDEYQERILSGAKALAVDLRAKTLSDSELTQRFNEKWRMWSRISPQKRLDNVNIVARMRAVLFDTFSTNRPVVIQELEKMPLDYYHNKPMPKLQGSTKLEDITKEDIAAKKGILNTLKNFVKGEERFRKQSLNLANGILEIINQKLENLTSVNRRFQDEAVEGLLEKLQEEISRHNENSSMDFLLRDTFVIKLAVHICRFAYPQFVQGQKTYDEKHSVAAQIDELKQMCFNVFRNAYHNKKDEITAADMFCDILKAKIKSGATSCMPDHIVDCMAPTFGTKNALIVRILLELIEKDNFEDYIKYIRDPHSFATSWIAEKINKEWFEKSGHSSENMYDETWHRIAKQKLAFVRKSVKKTIDDRSEKRTLKTWVDVFHEDVSGQVPISCDTLKQFSLERIKDMDSLKDLIEEGLNRIQDELKQEKSGIKSSGFVWDNISPSSEIMDQIWGCPARCPFCFEPCSDTSRDHIPSRKHQCVQHRPQGINGWHGVSNMKVHIETCSYSVYERHSEFYCFAECRKLNDCSKSEHTHKYRDYASLFKQWHIHPVSVVDSSPYWCYFMNRHHENLQQHYDLNPGNIPLSWADITKEEAKDSLVGLN